MGFEPDERIQTKEMGNFDLIWSFWLQYLFENAEERKGLFTVKEYKEI